MLKIRFNRTGKKNRAQFRIVLQEHTIAPGGRHIELLGSYDPHTKKSVIQGEKIKEWMGKGAQVSDSVYNLLIKEKILEGKKRPVKIKKAEQPAESSSAPATADKEVKAEEVPKVPEAEKTSEEKPAEEKEVKSEEKPAEPVAESTDAKAMADKEKKESASAELRRDKEEVK